MFGLSILISIGIILLCGCIALSALAIILIFLRPDFGRIVVVTSTSCAGFCGVNGVVCLVFSLTAGLILAAIVTISYFAHIFGNSGITTISTLLSTLTQVFYAIFGLWNGLSPIVPVIATVINVILQLLSFFIGGVLGLACTGSVFDVGFNPAVNCSVLFGWLDIAPILARVIKDVVVFIITLLDLLLYYALWTGTCVRDGNCTRMCSMTGEDPGCYSSINAIIWVLQCSNYSNLLTCNIFEFIINVFDFFFLGPLFYLIKWIANIVYVKELIYVCENWCYWNLFVLEEITDAHGMVVTILVEYESPNLEGCISGEFGDVCREIFTIFEMIVNIVDSSFELIPKIFLAILIQFIISPIDSIYCRVLTRAIVPCILGWLCRLILPGFLESGCPGEGDCVCENCSTGFPFIRSACTMEYNCECPASYTLLESLVRWVKDLGK